MSETSVTAFSSGIPLYKEVGRQISKAIHTGEWKPGEALPAEKKLSERFGVSMGTLRKAMDELVAKGVLIRQQGRGTFVSKHSKLRYLFAFFHVVRQDGHKEYPLVELLEFSKTKAEASAARLLGVETASALTRLLNVLSLDGRPAIVDEIFLPNGTFAGMTRKMIQNRPGTLYQLYQEEFGVTVIRTEERLRAVKADALKAGLLGLKTGDPLLQVIRVARSFNNEAVELRYSYINTANYEYYAELVANS